MKESTYKEERFVFDSQFQGFLPIIMWPNCFFEPVKAAHHRRNMQQKKTAHITTAKK
jgi:hypothetical protein